MSPLLFRRLSDEHLGSRLASGEAAAFDELYRRYVHRLAAYGTHLLGDGAAGDDIAQATLLKAYAALRDGRVPRLMRPWLYRIAHNAALDVLANRRELPWAEPPEQPARERSPHAGALLDALAALPDRQRRVYALREVHGLKIAETAAELGLTATQVEQALFAARNRLAEHLVFGDRLDCVTVERLSAGPLDRDERRALKTHLRSCPGCRASAGLRERVSVVMPAGLGWFRGLLSGLGGGAPVAAKITAVAATSSLAAGVPTIVHLTDKPAPRVVLAVSAPRRHVTPARPIARPGLSMSTYVAARSAAAVPVTHAAPAVRPAPAARQALLVEHRDRTGREGRSADEAGASDVPARTDPVESSPPSIGDGPSAVAPATAEPASPGVQVAVVPSASGSDGHGDTAGDAAGSGDSVNSDGASAGSGSDSGSDPAATASSD